MPKALAPIPVGVQIVDHDGAITIFYRLRWQELIDSFQLAPTVATTQLLGQTAALPVLRLFTTRSAGLYRVSYYVRKTVADGAASALTVTLGWTESGFPLSESGIALTTDTTGAEQSGSKLVWADAATDLTITTLYTSATPNRMTYRLDASVEQLA